MSDPVNLVPTTAARILVVDDDPDLIDVIQEVLKDEGLDVEAATDGRQAVAVAETRPPDLVVLDMTLPVLDGVQVATRLARLSSGGIPVLVITADGNAAAKAAQVGAFAYLRKPFRLGDLVDTVWRGLHTERPE